eukprot:c21665_g2_i1.p1 GENE.c21665_g2_i1~~c21665_g2_i1.p1  ORF type:complete len:263 (-),score=90.65 c21665_g2_i1:22-810(-)
MQLSKELANVFRTNFSPQFEFFPTILTKGSWPCEQLPPCILPTQLLSMSNQFESFYLTKFNGRKLTWQSHMGNGELKGRVGDQDYEFSVNTYQMIILLLFNNYESLTFEQIAEKTQITSQDLEKQLHSLICAKNMILKCSKSKESKEFSSADAFQINHEFSHKTPKVKVVHVSSGKEAEVQKKQTKEKADEDRKYEIEAAIIRVMKDRKVLSYNNLMAEVTKQLQKRFQPSVALIKQRIEGLLEREFISRSVTDMQEFRYVA